jgi:DNA-dependent protein kinase catalytic subunit
LAEFLQWSIKQTSAKQQEKNPFNVKSLFKRLYSLAHHPDPYKRLGCALTMKKLYRVLREEPTLVDQFLLEIIHTMLFSLRLASNDANSLGTVAILEQVCEALAKIALHYKGKLVKPNPKRRMHRDLGRFLNWSLQQMGRVEAPVRRVAFSLILST